MKKKILTILLVAVLVLVAATNVLAADPDDPYEGDTQANQDLFTTNAVVSGAGSVIQVNPADIPCEILADFQDVAAGNYDGILSSGGLQIAERFAGQVLSYDGDHDVLSGSPSSPLALQVGAANCNVHVSFIGSYGNVMDGLGYKGYPNNDAIGEGSVAVLFPYRQSQFKFTIIGGSGGIATLNFFRANGSSLGTIAINAGSQTYGFGHSGGLHEIAGFSIHNTEYGGFGIDNICYEEYSLEDRVNALEVKLHGEVQPRLDALEAEDGNQNNRLNAVEDKLHNEVQPRLDALESEDENQNAQLAALLAEDENQNNWLSALQAENEVLKAENEELKVRLAAVEAKLHEEVQPRLDALEAAEGCVKAVVDWLIEHVIPSGLINQAEKKGYPMPECP